MTIPKAELDIEELARRAASADFGRLNLRADVLLALVAELTELRAMKLAVHDLAECRLGGAGAPTPAWDFDMREIERLTR